MADPAHVLFHHLGALSIAHALHDHLLRGLGGNAAETGVFKAASGAYEHVPVTRVTNLSAAMEELRGYGIRLVGLDSEAASSLGEVEISGQIAGSRSIAVFADRNPMPLCAAIEFAGAALPYCRIQLKLAVIV